MQTSSNKNTNTLNPRHNNILEKALKKNLDQFGLNPENWHIDFKQQNFALIKNADESDFQFIGKINSTRNDWEYIKLFNI